MYCFSGRISPKEFDSVEKKFRFKGNSGLSSFLPDLPTEEANPFSYVDKLGIPLQDWGLSPTKFRGRQNEMDSFLCTDYFPQGDYGPLVKCTSSGILRGEDYECRSDDNFCFDDTSFRCAERNLLKEEQRGDSYLRANFFSSMWKEEPRGVDSIISHELGVDTLSSDSPEGFLIGRDRRKLFRQGCLAQGKASFDGLYFGRFQTDDFRRKQSKINPPDDDMCSPGSFPMRSWHEQGCHDIDISSYSRPRMDPFLWSGDFMEMENASSSGHSMNSSWLSAISDPLLHDTTWDGKFHMDGIALESSLSSKQARKRHPPDKMCRKLRYDIIMQKLYFMSIGFHHQNMSKEIRNSPIL